MTTVEKYPLEKRKIIKKTVKVIFYAYILFFIFRLFANIFLRNLYQTPLMILDIFFALLPIIILVYEIEYYKKYFYDIREDFLVIKKGVITPTETILPYDKFQDVYVDQDVFDRLFKLYDVHVSTATFMSGIQAHIDGVNKENGQLFREMILKNIKSRQKK